MSAAASTAWIGERFRERTRPPESLSVSEWSDQHVIIPEGSAAEPGPYRTSRTPYMREVADCFSDDEVEEIVFIKGAQVGGTQVLTNAIAWKIVHDPGPIMIIQPNKEVADRFSKERMAPLIASTPVVKALVAEPTNRDSDNTIAHKGFVGGDLVIANAGSPHQLRMKAVEWLFYDEEDSYVELIGEGHPSELARVRTNTFARTRKIAHVSTPLVAGMSRVEALFNESDRCYYFVPCPHCLTPQRLTWGKKGSDDEMPGGIKWQQDASGAIVGPVLYQCEHCLKMIEEAAKPWMLEQGSWVSTAETRRPRLRGFQISSIYSPLGWLPWSDMVVEFLNAKGQPSKLKSFVNLHLGETWEEKGNAPAYEDLMKTASDGHSVQAAPRDVAVVTMGVDVQVDRLEWEYWGWAKGMRRVSLNRDIIMGDPKLPDPWAALEAARTSPIPREDGGFLHVSACAVDTGYLTEDVYAYVRSRQPSVIAVKGGTSSDAILSESYPDSKAGGVRKRRGAGVRLLTVDVGRLKKDFYACLALVPNEGVWPPSSVRIPQDYNQEYFEQLTAEELRPVLSRGYLKLRWQKMRDRNEALDLAVYAEAAARNLKLDRWSDDRWDEELLRLDKPDAVATRSRGGLVGRW